MLGFLIISLPSVEAPKNIFLVSYLLTRLSIETLDFKEGARHWTNWDTLFLILVLTAFLSTFFAGMPGLEEWKGYKVFLTGILTGWALSRAKYTKKNYQGIFQLVILSTIPPLLWGTYEYLIVHSRSSLEIHSVGHVNHSAIYLVIIFGASLGWFLSKFNSSLKASKFSLILLGFLTLIFFIGLIIGQSRGAFGVAVILGFLITYLLAKDKKIGILVSVAIVSIVLSTVLLNASIIQKQITYQENHNTLAFRDRVWNVSLEASRFYPALGIGMSNWHFITKDQLKKSVEERGVEFNPENYIFPGHSHNLYLTALVERGFVGLLVTLLFMAAWMKNLINNYALTKRTQQGTYLWAGSFSAWVATFGIGFVNTTFHHEHAILACLLYGLYLSYSSRFINKKQI
jgi:O-antigen ligase